MKWNRKLYKKNGRKSLKRNYWFLIAVCFLTAMIAGEFAESTDFISRYSAQNEKEEVVQPESQKDPKEIVTKDKNYKIDLSTTKGILTAIEIQVVGNAQNGDSLISKGIMIVVKSQYMNENMKLITLILAATVGLFIWLFFAFAIKQVLLVGKRHYLLENRDHLRKNTKVPIREVLFNFQKKYWVSTSKIMFFKWLYMNLWMLTIVGGFIKYYEYRMIPYIVADNPMVTRREAFALSKEMMKGHKMSMFFFDLSFWYWYFIEVLTFGLAGLFYYSPYKSAAECEVYLALRSHAIMTGFPGADQLNALRYTEAMEEYLEYENDNYIEKEVSKLKGHIPVDEIYEKKILPKFNPMRKYSVANYILFFFTFAIIGWLWEVSIHLVEDGVFVNRGVSYGPWLPIYGCGGVAALLLLRRFAKKPIMTFFLTMVVASIIEYFTSWFLEYTKGVRWWDYSGYFCNLNGRICLEGAVIFGIGGCLMIYVVGPRLAELYDRIAKPILIIICTILVGGFAVDEIYSINHPNMGKGITDYKEWKDTDSVGTVTPKDNQDIWYIGDNVDVNVSRKGQSV